MGGLATYMEEDSATRTAGAPAGTKFVDLTAVSDDGATMVVEHTMIESYEQQLHEARQIEVLLPLEDRFAGELHLTSRF